jgi:hypothetical protein
VPVRPSQPRVGVGPAAGAGVIAGARLAGGFTIVWMCPVDVTTTSLAPPSR